MPFYAIVQILTGDIIDVVESYDEDDLPPGAMSVELPAKEDDIRRWLALRNKNRGGGGNGEVFVERGDGGDDGKKSGRKDELSDSEAFFARLQQEIIRSELEGRHLAVLLFYLAPIDRAMPQEFVTETLQRHGQELLPCDLVSRVRDHLVGMLMPDTDSAEIRIVPARGAVTALTFPADRDQIDLVRRRRHPLLRKSVHRG